MPGFGRLALGRSVFVHEPTDASGVKPPSEWRDRCLTSVRPGSRTGCAIRDVDDRVPESPLRLARMIDRADASPGTPEIRLTDLTKHFREVRAVDRVSMDIRPGEFFSM